MGTIKYMWKSFVLRDARDVLWCCMYYSGSFLMGTNNVHCKCSPITSCTPPSTEPNLSPNKVSFLRDEKSCLQVLPSCYGMLARLWARFIYYGMAEGCAGEGQCIKRPAVQDPACMFFNNHLHLSACHFSTKHFMNRVPYYFWRPKDLMNQLINDYETHIYNAIYLDSSPWIRLLTIC